MTSRNDDPQSNAPWLRDLASNVDYKRFRRIWLHPVTEQAEQGYLAACYERIAQRANSEGEYFLAYDSANNGLRCAIAADFPPHTLVALKVTALARSGAAEAANGVMEQFLAEHEPDACLCSAQARLFRDRGIAASKPAEYRRLLNEAAEWASRAKDYATKGGKDWVYPANQEVQFRFLAGQHDIARAGTLAVIDFVESYADAGSMWNQINLAEMRLIRGELATAGQHYQKAAELGATSPGDIAACLTVAKVLLREFACGQPVDTELLERWFPQPALVVFAGHIPDARTRPTSRLPEATCRPGGVAACAIEARIRQLNAVEGICASAPGGDILFAEALIAAGASITLVNPFPRRRIETIAAGSGEDWSERLVKILHAAGRSESIACAEDADEGAQCDYATHVMLGAAMLRAKRINAKLHALVLWDEADADSPNRGGTGQFVALCRQANVPVEIINPLTMCA